MFYFLHVSKSAGSSFIALARKNVSMFLPNANGNPINHVTGERLKYWKWTPEEQHYFLTAGTWQLVANENQLGHGHEFFEGVRYIVILREPLDRLFSAWQFAIEKPGKEVPLEERGRKFAHFLRNETGINWRRNYLLNTLTYQDRGHSPERLEVGKQRLAQFDHVFLMNDLATDIQGLARDGWMQLDLPWRNTAAPGEANWSAARAALADYPDLLKGLSRANEQDLELYAFARELVEKRKNEAPQLDRRQIGERQMPESDNFEFLVACAYEAFLKKDMPGCRKLLKRAASLPEANEMDPPRRDFAEFALRRFAAPDRAEKEHRRKAREKKAAHRAAAKELVGQPEKEGTA